MKENLYIYIAIVIILVLLLLTFYVVNVYNKIINYKKKVTYNWSLIDIELKRKAEVLPNLTSLLKSQMKFESEELEKLTKLRSKMLNASINEKIEANEDFNVLINLIKEGYPSLQSHNSYIKLMDEINDAENKSPTKTFYNEMVMSYNRFIENSLIILLQKYSNFQQLSILHTKYLIKENHYEKKFIWYFICV